MKQAKTFFYWIAVGVLLMGLLFVASCSDDRDEEDALKQADQTKQEDVSLRERVSVEGLESRLARALWHQVNAIEDVVETVQMYVDIPEEEERLTRSGRDFAIGLERIGQFFPSDLSKLRRTEIRRNTRGESEEVVISFQEELDQILAAYERDMRLLVPDVGDEELGGMAFIEGGMIHLADGLSYPQNSIEGIGLVEVLQAVANGEDGEAVAARINAEIEEMFGDDLAERGERGVYLRVIPRWVNGVVTYKWDDLKSSFRPEVRRAMNDWESGSGGRVKFREFNGNAWDWAQVILGIKHVVRISDESDLGAAGKALPGSWPWGISFMRLRSSLPITNTLQTVYPVALHELGHVLGLQHEHQRADRDNFVTVAASDLNNIRLPEVYLNTPRIEIRTVKIGFIRIPYPVIVFKPTPQFSKTTAFDFNSIMIYPDLPIKAGYRNTANGILGNDGIWRTKYTTRLSDLDKQFIRQLY